MAESLDPKSLIKGFGERALKPSLLVVQLVTKPKFPPTQYPLLRNFGEPSPPTEIKGFLENLPSNPKSLKAYSKPLYCNTYIVLKQNSATHLKTNFQVVPASVRISGVPNAVAPNDEPRKLNAWI